MSRLTLIKSLVAEDNTAIKLLTSVSAAIRRYGDCVFSMERSLQAVRFRLEGEELRDLTVRLDRNRHTAHESLISSIIAANRYLFRTFGVGTIPAGGVYDGDPLHIKYNNREAIGEWAINAARGTA
ncbi:MAG: DUF3232 domain-containing protein [Dissulfurispiraceae bacterium]